MAFHSLMSSPFSAVRSGCEPLCGHHRQAQRTAASGVNENFKGNVVAAPESAPRDRGRSRSACRGEAGQCRAVANRDELAHSLVRAEHWSARGTEGGAQVSQDLGGGLRADQARREDRAPRAGLAQPLDGGHDTGRVTERGRYDRDGKP